MSKLDKLVADPNFGKGAKDYDTGIMLYQNKEALNYIILTYVSYYEVYLSLYDGSRDYLAYGKEDELEIAKELAISEIEKKINKPIH